MKKISCVFMVAVLIFSLFGCNKKNVFTDEKAIEVIKNSDYIESICADLDIDVEDVEIEVVENEVEEDEAKVKCKMTYNGDYVKSKETVVFTLEKDDDEWEVDKVKSKKELEHTPIKFPDKAKIVVAKGEDYPTIKVNSVIDYYGEDGFIAIYNGYEASKVDWKVVSCSDDLTSGYVEIDIKFSDYNKTLTYTGNLYFDEEIGKWYISVSGGDYVDSGNNGTNNEEPEIDYGSGTITIWVSEQCVDIVKIYANKFINSNEAYSGYYVNVEPVDEYYATKYVLNDIDYAADIYGFSSDYLEQLVKNGALTPLSGTYESFVKNNNDSASVYMAQYDGQIYAFPRTNDNGYFLIYDESVVTDPSSLEAIIADCESAGKKFYFHLSNGWYNPSLLFATECALYYDIDSYGDYTRFNTDIDSEQGLVALKEMIDIASSPAHVNSSDIYRETDLGAVVVGTWVSDTALSLLGDNCATAKLPTFTGSDGREYQMSGFSTCKLWGVKPQSSQGKQLVCMELAEYLSSAEVQLATYEALGFVPSNLEAQYSYEVQADMFATALIEQNVYAAPQGQYPNGYWEKSITFGDEICDGVVSIYSSNNELRAFLQKYVDIYESYAN